MPAILPQELLDRVNDLINDKGLEKANRDSSLQDIAREVWDKLFPEKVHRLPKEIIMKRWEEVCSQLSDYPNKEKILRVLESPASGGRFYWLDSP
jgi:hypothetical protein